MGTYHNILGFISTNVISCIFLSVIIIIFGKLFLKDKSGVPYAAAIVKWILIVYAGLELSYLVFTTLIYLVEALRDSYSQVSYNQYHFVAGPYWLAQWLMFSCAIILPLMLLFKKLGRQLWFLLLVSILINSGALFERIVIYLVSLQHDYVPSSWTMFYPSSIIRAILLAVLIGAAALVAGYFIAKAKEDVQI